MAPHIDFNNGVNFRFLYLHDPEVDLSFHSILSIFNLNFDFGPFGPKL